ncbi:MAG TPA: 50S ribosomal protein L9 [Candidatus Limnocylindrales bacterium]|nr:50S ribosomal protein L9 [Candidatus Limnocylindrales bacterium]
MEVILREDVPELGIIGDVVKVRPGYARNYLLPRGMAVVADRRSLAQLEHQKKLIEIKKQRERGTYERLAGSLKGLKVEIEARAGRGGKLFGSVTNQDVHRLLVEKGFEIDRRRIELREPIKEIGEFPVPVRVGQDISATITVVVRPLGGMLEGGAEEESAAPAATEPAVQSEQG